MEPTQPTTVYDADPIHTTAEERLAVRQSVNRILAESATLKEAAERFLPAIGEPLDWGLGVLWTAQCTNVLQCATIWHDASITATEFETASRESAFPPGIGLPGRVWKHGEAVWISNVLTDTNFPRLNAAAKVGLHSAFAFPVKSGQRFFAVIEFFSFEILPPDEDLLELAAELGTDIGRFEERRREEDFYRLQADLCQTLADPLRLELIHLLSTGSHSTPELAQATGQSPARIRRHLAVLRQYDLILMAQRGPEARYTLASPSVHDAYRSIRELLLDRLARYGALASVEEAACQD